jgi:hypothetical protein
MSEKDFVIPEQTLRQCWERAPDHDQDGTFWTGLAADLWRSGTRSVEWLLRGAVKGEVYAAGHAETGNDLPVLLSTAKATRVKGGYSFRTGRRERPTA